MSVSELASMPCCRAVFETPGECRFPGIHHLPEGHIGISLGCSMHLSLRQCRKGDRVSPVDTTCRLEAWHGLCPVFYQGSLLPGGHGGRVTLGTSLQTLWGKVAPVVLLGTMLDSELCPVSAQCCGSRTLGWDSRELAGVQAAYASPRLPFEQSLPQRNHHFPCPASPALLPRTHSC